jgi:hypothetical protein
MSDLDLRDLDAFVAIARAKTFAGQHWIGTSRFPA